MFKHDVEKRDNLYFSAVTTELFQLHGRAGFGFVADLPSSAVDVVDLDNLATFEPRAPGDLTLDDPEMQALVEPDAVKASALQKFKINVLDISLVFFPVWRFLVRDTQSTSERDLCIDGLKGQPLTINPPVRPGRKKK